MRKTGSLACRTKSNISMLCRGVTFVPDVSAKKIRFIGEHSYLLLLMILLVLCPLARGQELAGTFAGTVTDATGAVISRATVTISLNGVDGQSRVVQTNDSGNYTATNLPAGTYTITIADPNFETFSDHNVILNVAQKRTVNAELKAGSQSQTVTVVDHPVARSEEHTSELQSPA